MVCGLAGAAAVPGCPRAEPEPHRPVLDTDPCAERLHDVCGYLLSYYAANRKLPDALGDLAAVGMTSPALLSCPTSGKPYTYDPFGPALPGRRGRLVVYDAEPTHAGMRWGILAVMPPGGGLISANVVLVSEKDLEAARR